MSDLALSLHQISKSFRVRRSDSGGEADPRREALGRRHERFWALRDVCFEVPRGQTLGLIGPNGSGKSTLLKILSGVMSSFDGQFEAAGRVGALLELGAGFHPELTGVENIYLSGSLLGLSTAQIDRMLPQIIAFSELERFMDLPVKHYSSGMVGRLGFSVASQLAPDILLLDETFATGDARFQAKAVEHVGRLKAAGHTMILVSHNAEMILHLADRVIWLDKGRVVRDGEPKQVMTEFRNNQKGNLHQNYLARNTLGVESLFEQRMEGEPAVTIQEARLAGADDEGLLQVPMGQRVTLDVTLGHGAQPPAQVWVETAWVRNGDRILAQSRVTAPLQAGQSATRVCVDFDDWPLVEADWMVSVGVAPVLEISDEAGAEQLLPDLRYYDRRIAAGTVRTTTPNPFDIPVAASIPEHWQHEAGV